MKLEQIVTAKFGRLIVLFALMAQLAPPAVAESPVKMKKFLGAIDLSADGALPFVLEGNASHLGLYRADGEVEFFPDEQLGSLVGEGVVVIEAANGDLLVGDVIWNVESATRGGDSADGLVATSIHFSWRDSVRFNDGTTVSNTGRFIKNRPRVLVIIAIINVLIGLILPAVQS